MRELSIAVVLSVCFLHVGCAAHTNLVPVGKGRVTAHASIGGPIVEAFDTHIPIPYLLVGADYGIRHDVNLGGSVHVLPLAYGVAGLDAGATWFVLQNDGWQPTLGGGPRLFAFASTKASVDQRFLVYPAASGSAAWAAGAGLLYAGADLAIPLDKPEYDDDASAVILSPFVGYRWDIGNRYALLTELKWHGANVRTSDTVAGYTAIGNYGAITPLLAVQRRF